MCAPMSKAIRYTKGKAVERILDGPSSVYIACEYRDMDAVIQSGAPPALAGPADQYAAADSETKRCLWRYVQELNRLARCASDYEMPTPCRRAMTSSATSRRGAANGARPR